MSKVVEEMNGIIQQAITFAAANSFLFSVVVAITLLYLATRKLTGRVKKHSSVFLEDFVVYHPEKAQQRTAQGYYDVIESLDSSTPETMAFQGKMLTRSGLGDQTAMDKHSIVDYGIEGAQAEMASTLEATMDALFARTGISTDDVDFLVVNCSVYCPTPSMTAWIVNHYKLPSKVRTFQLGGMGCSASLIGVDLVNDLLTANPGKKAVLVSTEVLSIDWYTGTDTAFSLQSALFRLGGAAMLFTGKRTRTSRYRVDHVFRTHHGKIDESFNAIEFDADSEGKTAIRLSRDVPKIAGKAINENIKLVAGAVLPLSEKVRYAMSLISVKLGRSKSVYVPNFKKGVDNFCIHTGGRGVIDTVQKNLSLSAADVEASRATLYRYGNTSSSSVWYELAYMENNHMMKPGNTVWQVAFGSGFKCNSVVLKALRGCRLNRHVFDAQDPTFRYSEEGCPNPIVKFSPEVQKAIDAFKASRK